MNIIKKILKKLNIHNKEDFKHFVLQFIKFGIIGVSNTLISWGIYYVIIIFVNANWYIGASIIGFIVSVPNSYYWNNKYVFNKADKGHIKTLLKTYLAYSPAFLFGTLVPMYIGIAKLGISPLYAPVVMVISIPLNFLINKFWAFRDQKLVVKEGDSNEN